MPTEPGHIAVVIPAFNEESTLGPCLAALQRAQLQLRSREPEITTSVVVVLDSCTDTSAQVASAHPQVTALEVTERCVGAARAAGVAHALQGQGADWIACTDADSTVPVDWLCEHAAAARAGFAARVGMVSPQPLSDEPVLPAQAVHAWHRAHAGDSRERHIFGANLGLSAAAYRSAGGFRPLDVGEDRDLIARLTAAGLPILTADGSPVATSSRTTSRVVGGFATFLAALESGQPDAEGGPRLTL